MKGSRTCTFTKPDRWPGRAELWLVVARPHREQARLRLLGAGDEDLLTVFASFQKAWGPDYLYAGVGSVIALP
jgi:hypothetical protein